MAFKGRAGAEDGEDGTHGITGLPRRGSVMSQAWAGGLRGDGSTPGAAAKPDARPAAKGKGNAPAAKKREPKPAVPASRRAANAPAVAAAAEGGGKKKKKKAKREPAAPCLGPEPRRSAVAASEGSSVGENAHGDGGSGGARRASGREASGSLHGERERDKAGEASPGATEVSSNRTSPRLRLSDKDWIKMREKAQQQASSRGKAKSEAEGAGRSQGPEARRLAAKKKKKPPASSSSSLPDVRRPEPPAKRGAGVWHALGKPVPARKKKSSGGRSISFAEPEKEKDDGGDEQTSKRRASTPRRPARRQGTPMAATADDFGFAPLGPADAFGAAGEVEEFGPFRQDSPQVLKLPELGPDLDGPGEDGHYALYDSYLQVSHCETVSPARGGTPVLTLDLQAYEMGAPWTENLVLQRPGAGYMDLDLTGDRVHVRASPAGTPQRQTARRSPAGAAAPGRRAKPQRSGVPSKRATRRATPTSSFAAPEVGARTKPRRGRSGTPRSMPGGGDSIGRARSAASPQVLVLPPLDSHGAGGYLPEEAAREGWGGAYGHDGPGYHGVMMPAMPPGFMPYLPGGQPVLLGSPNALNGLAAGNLGSPGGAAAPNFIPVPVRRTISSPRRGSISPGLENHDGLTRGSRPAVPPPGVIPADVHVRRPPADADADDGGLPAGLRRDALAVGPGEE